MGGAPVRPKTSLVLALFSLFGCGAPESAGPFRWNAVADSATAGSDVVAVAGSGAGDSAGAAPLAQGGSAGGLPASNGSAGMDSALAGSGGVGGVGLPVPNAFTGAPAFVSAPVTKSAAAQMTSNPSKTQCLSCHNGDQGVHAFMAGGTVFTNAAGSAPAIDYEVRVVDTSTNAVFSAHTDANGNFWIEPGAQLAAGPFMIGVRNGEHVQAMPVLQRALECNGSACHGGMQGPIHVP